MMKRMLSLLLAAFLIVGMLPAAALAADGETITVTVDMDTRAVAEDVSDYGLTALPASTSVTVPKDSTVEAVLQQWSVDTGVAVDKDPGYVKAIGDFGERSHPTFAAMCAGAGVDPIPGVFEYAGWIYGTTGNACPDVGIDQFPVSDGETVTFRYTVYMDSTGCHRDFAFLAAYDSANAALTEAKAAAAPSEALQAAITKTEGDLAVTAYEGMWLNFFADQQTNLWGSADSITELLKTDAQLLKDALAGKVTPETITVTENNPVLTVGTDYQIQYTVGPEGAPQDAAFEPILGTEYYTVSDTGVITPTAPSSGKCMVFVKIKGGTAQANLMFTIQEAPKPPKPEPETISVYLTVSDRGLLAKAKDGTVMAQRPVTVTDLDADGKYTYDEALKAAHEQYLTADAYHAASGFATKVWGSESGGFLFFNNDAAIPNGVGTDTVAQGDYLTTAVMKDLSAWSDQYVFFDVHTREAAAGEPVALILKTSGGMAPVNPAKPVAGMTVGTWENGAFVSADAVTDASGAVALSFPTAGTYYVTASGTLRTVAGWPEEERDCPIIAPVCIVTVTGEMSGAQQQEKVDADAAALTFDTIKNKNTAADRVTGSLTLPTRGASGLTSVAWIVDNPAVDAATGAVTRPAAGEPDAVVTLIATVTLGEKTAQKTITVTVPALEEDQAQKTLKKAAEALTAQALTPVEFTGGSDYGYAQDSTALDTNLLTKAQALVDAAAEGVTVTLQTTANAAVAADGAITYGEQAVAGAVTFRLAFSGKTETVAADITVPAHAITKAEVLAAPGLTFDSFKGSNADKDHVVEQLPLPAKYSVEDGAYDARISWTSGNPDVIKVPGYASNDVYKTTVTRPAAGEPDAVVTLTARVQPGDYWAYGMAPAGPMPEPAYVEKTFEVTVPAVAQDETAQAQALVDEAIKLFTLDNVTVRGTEDKADLMAITYHLNDVPYNWNYVKNEPGFREEYREIQVVWTSSNPGITKVNSGVTVARTAEDQTGDIILTLTCNGAVAEKKFPTRVLAFTEAHAKAEMDDLKKVSDALTFDAIKKDNTDPNAVTTTLEALDSGKIEGDQVVFGTRKAYHVPGANITWTSSHPEIIEVAWDGLKVTQPQKTTQVTLTATLESIRYKDLPGVTTLTKEIVVAVPGTEPAPEPELKPIPDTGKLLENIAADFAANDRGWEAMLGLSLYNTHVGPMPLNAELQQNYVNTVAEKLLSGEAGESDYFKAALSFRALGLNPEEIYPANSDTPFSAVHELTQLENSPSAWSAPYALLAYQAAGENTDAQQTALVEKILANQGADGSWDEFGKIDTTANVIAGLAAYYDSNAAVKAALDRAVAFLSEAQGDNGSWSDGTGMFAAGPNSNTTAMVVMALSAMGIDPAEDARFVKNGCSALYGLLTFALEDQTGFGHTDNKTLNLRSNAQAFPALIAALQVHRTGKALIPYDFGDMTVVPARVTGKDDGGDDKPADRFDDVSSGSWFYDDVNFVAEEGVFVGTGERTFSPNAPMTRAMFVTVLYRMEGAPKAQKPAGFTDVPGDTWYTDAVAWAAGHGIVAGVSEKTFAPHAEVSREQIAAILYRYSVYKEMSMAPGGDLSAFRDADQISGYAETSVAWAVAEELIVGSSADTLAPRAGATRAQVAAILHRYLVKSVS